MVVIGLKWFYSGKSSCIRTKCFYSGKVVVFGQKGCYRVMWLYSGKVVVFRKKGLCSSKKWFFRAEVVVL